MASQPSSDNIDVDKLFSMEQSSSSNNARNLRQPTQEEMDKNSTFYHVDPVTQDLVIAPRSGPTSYGIIRWFDPHKGFGFIALLPGKPIFLPPTTLPSNPNAPTPPQSTPIIKLKSLFGYLIRGMVCQTTPSEHLRQFALHCDNTDPEKSSFGDDLTDVDYILYKIIQFNLYNTLMAKRKSPIPPSPVSLSRTIEQVIPYKTVKEYCSINNDIVRALFIGVRERLAIVSQQFALRSPRNRTPRALNPCSKPFAPATLTTPTSAFSPQAAPFTPKTTPFTPKSGVFTPRSAVVFPLNLYPSNLTPSPAHSNAENPQGNPQIISRPITMAQDHLYPQDEQNCDADNSLSFSNSSDHASISNHNNQNLFLTIPQDEDYPLSQAPPVPQSHPTISHHSPDTTNMKVRAIYPWLDLPLTSKTTPKSPTEAESFLITPDNIFCSPLTQYSRTISLNNDTFSRNDTQKIVENIENTPNIFESTVIGPVESPDVWCYRVNSPRNNALHPFCRAHIFAHQSSLASRGFRRAAEGQIVEFSLVDIEGKLVAKHVTGLNRTEIGSKQAIAQENALKSETAAREVGVSWADCLSALKQYPKGYGNSPKNLAAGTGTENKKVEKKGDKHDKSALKVCQIIQPNNFNNPANNGITLQHQHGKYENGQTSNLFVDAHPEPSSVSCSIQSSSQSIGTTLPMTCCDTISASTKQTVRGSDKVDPKMINVSSQLNPHLNANGRQNSNKNLNKQNLNAKNNLKKSSHYPNAKPSRIGSTISNHIITSNVSNMEYDYDDHQSLSISFFQHTRKKQRPLNQHSDSGSNSGSVTTSRNISPSRKAQMYKSEANKNNHTKNHNLILESENKPLYSGTPKSKRDIIVGRDIGNNHLNGDTIDISINNGPNNRHSPNNSSSCAISTPMRARKNNNTPGITNYISNHYTSNHNHHQSHQYQPSFPQHHSGPYMQHLPQQLQQIQYPQQHHIYPQEYHQISQNNPHSLTSHHIHSSQDKKLPPPQQSHYYSSHQPYSPQPHELSPQQQPQSSYALPHIVSTLPNPPVLVEQLSHAYNNNVPTIDNVTIPSVDCDVISFHSSHMSQQHQHIPQHGLFVTLQSSVQQHFFDQHPHQQQQFLPTNSLSQHQSIQGSNRRSSLSPTPHPTPGIMGHARRNSSSDEALQASLLIQAGNDPTGRLSFGGTDGRVSMSSITMGPPPNPQATTSGGYTQQRPAHAGSIARSNTSGIYNGFTQPQLHSDFSNQTNHSNQQQQLYYAQQQQPHSQQYEQFGQMNTMVQQQQSQQIYAQQALCTHSQQHPPQQYYGQQPIVQVISQQPQQTQAMLPHIQNQNQQIQLQHHSQHRQLHHLQPQPQLQHSNSQRFY